MGLYGKLESKGARDGGTVSNEDDIAEVPGGADAGVGSRIGADDVDAGAG